jgi:hypothetical protein
MDLRESLGEQHDAADVRRPAPVEFRCVDVVE